MNLNNYKVEYSIQAVKQLKKLDKNLQNCENPRQHGKALVANRKGQWRYRIGDYRLIVEIEDEKIKILVLNVGHRRDVYDN